MRSTALVFDVALLIVVAFLIVEDGWPGELHVQLMVILFIAAPVINIAALLRTGSQRSENWLSLFIERKKLEERAKITNLRKSGHSE